MKSTKNIIGVEAVNKALEILNCFTERNEALTITKIANITGDHKSRISRISKSLENFGYIRKINSGEFKIGHSISRLYEIYDTSFNFKNSIKSELDFISGKLNETASLFVKQKDWRVCIQTSEPKKIIKHSIQIGTKKPLDKGSSGHILSAYHNLEIRDKEKILKQGYSMSFGERDREIASISVPIFRTKKQFLGSLTVTGHISNFNKKNCLYFLNILRSSKIKIEKKFNKIQ
jgi:DNA-binding IclR family transcriptional regulator|tara:strand:+ start:196 stop:894 length:699 start_codon:yes stop_codon:yes gene_type:complete